MKKNSISRRVLAFAGAAVMLVGLLFTAPAAVPVSAAAVSQPSAGDNFDAGDTIKVTSDTLNIRSGPGMHYSRRGMLTEGYVAVLDKVDGDWGKIGDGWINLEYVDRVKKGSGSSTEVSHVQPQAGQRGYVTASVLNIRTGPGTGYTSCGSLTKGYSVRIDKVDGNWGKIDEGWICLNYVRTDGSSNPSQSIVSGSKVKVTASQLNVRKGPGTGYGKQGSLDYGDVVEILEIKGSWGRTGSGWICLDYTVNYSGSGSAVYSGSVVRVTSDTLRIRSGPGTGYEQRGVLTKGYRVAIEKVQDDWGRIDLGTGADGWINLTYTEAV